MNVFWVAQDNTKNGSFKQSKAEVMCTISSLLIIKHLYPEYKTTFFLDNWTKKYYDNIGVLKLFDEVNTSVLDKPSKINFQMFYAASKLIAMSTLTGPALNLDLDFFLFSDIRKLGMFDCDVSCFYLETNEYYAYVQPERGMRMVPFKWDLAYDEDAFNVSIFFIKNGFFRSFYSEEMIRYMEHVSENHFNSFPEEEYFQLNLFVDQYLVHQFVKKYNQSLKIFINDVSPIQSKHNHVSSVGINTAQAINYCYHFGNHKQFLKDPNFNNSRSDFFYTKTIEMIGESEPLENLYKIPFDDIRFKS